MWVLTAVTLPPFVCVGVFVSHVFARYSSGSGYLYFADLTGAALGAIGVIALLQLVGGVNASVVCGVIAAGAVVLVGVWARRTAVTAVGIVLVLGMGVFLQQNLSRKLVDLPYLRSTNSPDAKPLYQDLGNKLTPARIVDSAWNAFARTDVVQYAGPDGKYHEEDDRLVYTDGEVPHQHDPFHGGPAEVRERLRGLHRDVPLPGLPAAAGDVDRTGGGAGRAAGGGGGGEGD